MSAFFPGPSHALLAPRVAELTWVVQPICRISDVAQSYGIGREGWATAVVTSCNKLLENDRKLEEYTTGLTAWRALADCMEKLEIFDLNRESMEIVHAALKMEEDLTK